MKKNVKLIFKTLLVVLIFASVVTSCKKDDEPATQVAVKMTDDPFPMPFVVEANIGILKVDLKNENGDYVTVFDGNTSVNLVNYTNGETAEVAVNDVPAGRYTEVRITMGDVSVKLTNDSIYNYSAVAHHSYTQAIHPAVVVNDGQTVDLLIDMDLSGSFRFGGAFGWISDVMDITGINQFSPKFRAVNLFETGSIRGRVLDANGNGVAYAEVKVRYDYDNDGQPEEVTTIAKADGSYKIIGLPQGSYAVEVEAENNLDGEVANVQVTVAAETDVNVTVN